MADNISVTPGTGATIGADDVGGVLYQKVKIDIGDDGASVPLTDVATSAKQDTGNTSLSSIDAKIPSSPATTDKQDTGNSSLSSIDTKTPSLGQALAASSVPVVLTAAQLSTITPPAAITGFATASNQTDKSQFTKLTDGTDTALITASGEQNVLATAQPGVDIGDVTINNGSGASAVNIQDGGNTITVDGTVTANLAAGTNNIGDVDVLTVPSDPFGANADAASATGSISAKLRFIASTGIPITGTVTVGSHAVTNAGTFLVQENGAALTSLQLIDDTIFTDDTSTHTTGTTKVVGIGAVATPTDTSVNANDIGMPAMTTDRRLLVDASGVAVPITDNSGSITVDQGTATNLKTQAENYQGGSAVAAGNPLQVTLANTGSNSTAVKVDGSAVTQPVSYATTGSGTATGALRVELPTNGTGVVGLNAGTNAIGKLAANSGVDIGDVDVTSIIPGTGATNSGKAEDAGHTGGDTGIFTLGVRNNTPNTATTNADADYSQMSTDMVGGVRMALYETDFAVLGTNHVKKYYTSTGAVTDGIIWSPAAGKRWYVTDIFVQTSAAATVTFEDDKAGGDEVVAKMELAANSGWAQSFNTPWFSGEDAADLMVTTSAGNIYVTVTGYEI